MTGSEKVTLTDTARADLMLKRVFGVANLLALVHEQGDTKQVGVEIHLKNRCVPDSGYREDEPMNQSG
jgi:hypothetical protein